MHDATLAQEWYARLTDVLATRGLTLDAPGDAGLRVVVPWHREWGFYVREHSESDVARTVSSAAGAQPDWRAQEDRRRWALARLAEELSSMAETFIHLISFENGKLLPAARMEVGAAIAALRSFANRAIPVESIRSEPSDTVEVVREPIGVIAAITPANMPLLMLINKLAPALLVGNVVVAKPSPYTPLTALLFEDLARRVLPEGVFSAVVGDARTGAALVAHERVGLIALTGSRAAGAEVMKQAAARIADVQLELGGNDAALILPDADLDSAIPLIFASAFSSSGQACVATKRVYAPRSLLERVETEFVALAERCRVGSPFDPDATHPAVTNGEQYRRVQRLIADAPQEGGRLLAGGVHPSDEGWFIRPTVVSGLAAGAELVDEEQFGPVVPIVPYDDIDAVVDAINRGPYGLGSTIWSNGPQEHARSLARQIEVGMVWINRTPVPDPSIPFGGTKQSGIGREGGEHGIDAFCEIKVIGSRGEVDA